MTNDVKCKTCPYLKRQKNYNCTRNSWNLDHPRCSFHCEHPKVFDVKEKVAPRINKFASFVGYDDGFSYELETLKTRLKWCPLVYEQKNTKEG